MLTVQILTFDLLTHFVVCVSTAWTFIFMIYNLKHIFFRKAQHYKYLGRKQSWIGQPEYVWWSNH